MKSVKEIYLMGDDWYSKLLSRVRNRQKLLTVSDLYSVLHILDLYRISKICGKTNLVNFTKLFLKEKCCRHMEFGTCKSAHTIQQCGVGGGLADGSMPSPKCPTDIVYRWIQRLKIQQPVQTKNTLNFIRISWIFVSLST